MDNKLFLTVSEIDDLLITLEYRKKQERDSDQHVNYDQKQEVLAKTEALMTKLRLMKTEL